MDILDVSADANTAHLGYTYSFFHVGYMMHTVYMTVPTGRTFPCHPTRPSPLPPLLSSCTSGSGVYDRRPPIIPCFNSLTTSSVTYQPFPSTMRATWHTICLSDYPISHSPVVQLLGELGPSITHISCRALADDHGPNPPLPFSGGSLKGVP